MMIILFNWCEIADSTRIAQEIANADRLLIVAAAGLSINPYLPNNPYHSKSDFVTLYPQLARYGYRYIF
jgi:hypothetical protein